MNYLGFWKSHDDLLTSKEITSKIKNRMSIFQIVEGKMEWHQIIQMKGRKGRKGNKMNGINGKHK